MIRSLDEFSFKTNSKKRKLELDLYSYPNWIQKLKNHNLEGHSGCVNTVQWNSEGNLLLSGSDDCRLNIFKPLQNKMVKSIFSGHTGNIFCGKFLPHTSDTKIISCAADHEVRFFDIQKETTTQVYSPHRDMVKKLEIEPTDPSIFYSCSQDGTVRYFDIRETVDENSKENHILIKLQEESSPRSFRNTLEINSISLNKQNSNYMICGGGDPFIRLYDRRKIENYVKKYSPKSIMDKKYVHITGVRFSQNGEKILGSYSEDNIYLFDVNENIDEKEEIVMNYEGTYSGHKNIRTVKEVNFFGARDEYVISGSDCGHIFFWKRDKNEIIQILKGDKYIVNCLSPHPKLIPILATSGIENNIKIWTPTDDEFKCSKMKEKDDIVSLNQNPQSQTTSLLPNAFSKIHFWFNFFIK
eukprot:gene2953-4963_t